MSPCLWEDEADEEEDAAGRKAASDKAIRKGRMSEKNVKDESKGWYSRRRLRRQLLDVEQDGEEKNLQQRLQRHATPVPMVDEDNLEDTAAVDVDVDDDKAVLGLGAANRKGTKRKKKNRRSYKILTDEERDWLSDAVGGVALSNPDVCYDMNRDLDRLALNFYAGCSNKVSDREGNNNGKMIVTVVELSTGRKIVGTTTVGWDGKKAGGRRDIYASLYEVWHCTG